MSQEKGSIPTNGTVKVSEWINGISSHEIYDSSKLAKSFTAKTGQQPCWPEHSTRETASAIRARGLGGNLDKKEVANAYGWEIAEALAEKFAAWPGTFQQGRGSRFRSAVAALIAAGQ